MNGNEERSVNQIERDNQGEAEKRTEGTTRLGYPSVELLVPFNRAARRVSRTLQETY